MDGFLAALAELLPFIAIGFAAQLVDGALGMAFGVITNTLLVGVVEMPPALASQRVHAVECFTTAASGISHLVHGNIDRSLFARLLIPGVIGGVAGAYLLSSIDAGAAKPFVLGYLALIGGVSAGARAIVSAKDQGRAPCCPAWSGGRFS